MAEIIDAHVHIGRYHLPIEHIDSLLKAAGISRAVVFADPESDDMANDSTYAPTMLFTTMAATPIASNVHITAFPSLTISTNTTASNGTAGSPPRTMADCASATPSIWTTYSTRWMRQNFKPS